VRNWYFSRSINIYGFRIL